MTDQKSPDLTDEAAVPVERLVPREPDHPAAPKIHDVTVSDGMDIADR